jgi:hypothetical protein
VVKSGGRQVIDEVSGEQISLLFNAELMAENGTWARSPSCLGKVISL